MALPIETERLVVRAFEPERDAEPMLAVYGDPEVMRYVPGGALPDFEAVLSTLRGYEEQQARIGFSSWALVERETTRVIGDTGFGVFAPTGAVELGYTLARSYWGRGYATEAAAACLQAGLTRLALPRVIALVDIENDRSARVAERIGMARIETIEAHGRPHVFFAAYPTR
ncbi:MAG TPA: GNAT family N-acetyltransferase [Gaiellaceae bacterium]|jgi:ribosomal-protein-alanine N-acetyltransferase|nr:GNAT family N-acetyltransferase [Gaiellaceae bacterium]